MSLRINKMIILLGGLGLATASPDLIAAVSIYCAATVFCPNTTHCEMDGAMGQLMYNDGAYIQNGTRSIPFRSAQSNNLVKGEAGCSYQTWSNWPSMSAFLSNASARLFPFWSNATKWMSDGENGAVCEGTPQDCPFVTDAPTLRR